MNAVFLFQYKQHALVLTAVKTEIHFNLYLAPSILAPRNLVNSLPFMRVYLFMAPAQALGF